jgi:hypothetical protein
MKPAVWAPPISKWKPPGEARRPRLTGFDFRKKKEKGRNPLPKTQIFL